MSRDLFKDMKVPEGEDAEKKEYTPPEEKVVDAGLVHRLLEHYTNERDRGEVTIWRRDEFIAEVQKLMLIMKDAGDKVIPQPLIDTLTSRLKDESDTKYFRRTNYLTAIIQALYNLGYSNEFIIDIREWIKMRSDVGWYLEGKPERRLTLNLYGDFSWCAHYVHYCDFTLYNDATWCGDESGYCNFTFHGRVEECSKNAVNCTFDLMPDAEIGNYIGDAKNSYYDRFYYTKFSYLLERPSGNKLRKMNDTGEWKRIR